MAQIPTTEGSMSTTDQEMVLAHFIVSDDVPDRVNSFLNIRVADIQAVYDERSARGAQFLTPPKQHATEIRCYIRDPDGYIVEVGQTTLARGWRPPS
jgi:Glyoxalase/Bleomycin resistance protein/Dioxygenase superfamily